METQITFRHAINVATFPLSYDEKTRNDAIRTLRSYEEKAVLSATKRDCNVGIRRIKTVCLYNNLSCID